MQVDDDIVDVAIIIVTAGANQKLQTRLTFVKAKMPVAFLRQSCQRLRRETARAIILVAANPADTYLHSNQTSWI